MIFLKENSFFARGSKKSLFSVNNVKFPEKFVYEIEIDGQLFVHGVSTIFDKKVPFWGP